MGLFDSHRIGLTAFSALSPAKKRGTTHPTFALLDPHEMPRRLSTGKKDCVQVGEFLCRETCKPLLFCPFLLGLLVFFVICIFASESLDPSC
jgi:hypothetical protein